MSDFPRALKLVQLSTGRGAKLYLARPKAYYSRAYTVRLVAPDLKFDAVTGLPYVDVAFPTPLKDTSWVPFFSITNYGDALIDQAFIQVNSVLNPSMAGFRALLSLAPPSDNYWLNWSIAELHNP